MMRLDLRSSGLLACTLLTACGDDGAGTSANPDTTGTSADTGAATDAPPVTGSGDGTVDPPTGGDGSGSASATTTGPNTGSTGAPTTSPTSSTSGVTGEPATTDPATTGAPDTTDSTAGEDTTTGGVKNVVRFVALGDTGEGNEAQYMVAQSIVALCAQKGCDFAMLLGDNFYDSGVDGVDDPQWQEKFEAPYEDFVFPIYPTLGNHDYGGNGIGVDFDTKKSAYQVEYTKVSQLWKLPAKYHSFKLAHAEFWDLDTNQVMTDPINGDSDKQRDWLKNGLAASQATWKIAFGHHPYISNGDHGNAGSYENLEGIPLPFVTGDSVKEFMEDAVCGQVDMYICGHDHNIQWLQPKCGTEFIVSGAGSKSEDLPGDNPAFFGMAETEGFVWIELADDSLTGIFYDSTGKELYSRTISK